MSKWITSGEEKDENRLATDEVPAKLRQHLRQSVYFYNVRV